MWVLLAFGSAFFAGLTAILAKVGVRGTDTDVATAIRTVVVLLFSWLMAWVTGSLSGIAQVGTRTWVFLILSGVATGASWLCYFRALQLGNVNQVAPIDKSSTVLTMLLAFVLLGEGLTPLKVLCMALIGTGAYLMIQPKPAQAAAAASNSPMPAATDAAAAPSAATAAQATGSAAAAMPMPAPDAHLFGENNPAIAGAPIAALAAPAPARTKSPVWLLYALGSAVFASLTAILGKIGIEGVNSTLGTAIRTCVVLVMAWAIVFGRGKQGDVRRVHRVSMGFLVLSGFATGASWLCYYSALQVGPASVVVPIDKLSILVSVAFSRIVFAEKLSLKAGLGLVLLVAGTLLLLL